jgi:uncharacterized membrane protein YciS (DUF1049 family)
MSFGSKSGVWNIIALGFVSMVPMMFNMGINGFLVNWILFGGIAIASNIKYRQNSSKTKTIEMKIEEVILNQKIKDFVDKNIDKNK